MSKIEELSNLYNQYEKTFGEKEYVFGGGNVEAALLLIGEAPGKDEVRLKKPFVGVAGKNLNEFLEVLQIQREDIYITNAIKYRLSKLNPETGRIVNRPALSEEISSSSPYLQQEIKILQPQYIITLGNVPLKAVTGDPSSSIGQAHGQIRPLDLGFMQCLLYPLYHPASVIYNASLKSIYMEDIRKLGDILHKSPLKG